jgi:hypothetical protein
MSKKTQQLGGGLWGNGLTPMEFVRPWETPRDPRPLAARAVALLKADRCGDRAFDDCWESNVDILTDFLRLVIGDEDAYRAAVRNRRYMPAPVLAELMPPGDYDAHLAGEQTIQHAAICGDPAMMFEAVAENCALVAACKAHGYPQMEAIAADRARRCMGWMEEKGYMEEAWKHGWAEWRAPAEPTRLDAAEDAERDALATWHTTPRTRAGDEALARAADEWRAAKAEQQELAPAA